MADEWTEDEREEYLNVEEWDRLMDDPLCSKAVRVELRRSRKTFTTLNKRVPMFAQYARVRVQRVQQLRCKMRTIIDEQGEWVSKQVVRDLYEQVKAYEEDGRALAESLENHDQNIENFSKGSAGFFKFLLRRFTDEKQELILH